LVLFLLINDAISRLVFDLLLSLDILNLLLTTLDEEIAEELIVSAYLSVILLTRSPEGLDIAEEFWLVSFKILRSKGQKLEF